MKDTIEEKYKECFKIQNLRLRLIDKTTNEIICEWTESIRDNQSPLSEVCEVKGVKDVINDNGDRP